MNALSKTKIQKLYDLNNQIFDYLKLTIYDLESKFDLSLSIENLKINLETFSDKHFKNSLDEFNEEIHKIKNEFPDIFNKFTDLTNDLKLKYFNITKGNFLEFDKINEIKTDFINYIDKIKKY